MADSEHPSGAEYWKTVLGSESGRMAWRSVPLKPDGPDYWHAAARIRKDGDIIVDTALALRGPDGDARRLGMVEQALLSGKLLDADGVLDAVRDLVECIDDEAGSAAAKSYLAGWICADVVGRCLK